jgi:K+-transporting ATPase KdpF subunit
MTLGLAMGGDNLVGIIISVLAGTYLVYALLRPEKL